MTKPVFLLLALAPLSFAAPLPIAVGSEADRGELPDDFEALSKLVGDVCSGNASRYFGF